MATASATGSANTMEVHDLDVPNVAFVQAKKVPKYWLLRWRSSRHSEGEVNGCFFCEPWL